MALMNVERVGVVVAGRIARTMGGTRRRLAALRPEIGGGYTSPNNKKQIKIQPCIQKSIKYDNDNDILSIKSQESVG
jgi:hypothetical protein